VNGASPFLKPGPCGPPDFIRRIKTRRKTKSGTAHDILAEGVKVASKGGKLLLDPSRRKNYYKSLVFLMDAESTPHETSLLNLDKAIRSLNGNGGSEPILAGIHQNRDLDLVKSVLA
jgi:hypothetical protein